MVLIIYYYLTVVAFKIWKSQNPRPSNPQARSLPSTVMTANQPIKVVNLTNASHAVHTRSPRAHPP